MHIINRIAFRGGRHSRGAAAAKDCRPPDTGRMVLLCGRRRSMKKTRAFTLIELLAVMAIMALMMTIAVASFYDWGKHSAMRGSISTPPSTLHPASL